MAKKYPEPTSQPRERAFLIGVEIFGQNLLLSLEESLAELARLADTAGLIVVGQTTQRLNKPNVQTYIGSGKLEEIQILTEELLAEVVIFDDELSPRHLREIERKFNEKVRVLDRTALILDIFAQHAHTSEGALQVELAQYEYRLPRLTRAWTHLARQSGGGGGRSGRTGGVGLRGPGETQLEIDRREIRRKIDHLKTELEKIRVHRQQYRAHRRRSRLPVVALVGYTNAGKSTLLNRLTGSDIYVADQLFATLDPTTRRVDLPLGRVALFTDTVGFIQKLPTTLVAAFQATLEEISEADLLLHIIDSTHSEVKQQAQAVHQTLKEINADGIPVLNVLNKIDRLENPDHALQSLHQFSDAVAISALNGDGIDELLSKVNQYLFENLSPLIVQLPFQEGNLISLFHEYGQVEKIKHTESGVIINGRIPERLRSLFLPYEKPG